VRELKALLDLLYRLVRLKVYGLLAWKVYRKLDYGRELLINGKLKQPLDSLRGADITALQILAYLIAVRKP